MGSHFGSFLHSVKRGKLKLHTRWLLSLRTCWPTWVMRSPRRMCRSCSPSWLTPKMRRASSPTLPSSTDCAARPKQLSSLNIPISFGTSTEDHCTGRSKVGQSLQTKTKLIENKNTIKNKPKTECICEHLTNTIIGLKCDN